MHLSLKQDNSQFCNQHLPAKEAILNCRVIDLQNSEVVPQESLGTTFWKEPDRGYQPLASACLHRIYSLQGHAILHDTLHQTLPFEICRSLVNCSPGHRKTNHSPCLESSTQSPHAAFYSLVCVSQLKRNYTLQGNSVKYIDHWIQLQFNFLLCFALTCTMNIIIGPMSNSFVEPCGVHDVSPAHNLTLSI